MTGCSPIVIKSSRIQDELIKATQEWEEKEKAFRAKIKAIKDKCTHQWNDGTSAAYEVRYSYNHYGEECEICGRRIDKPASQKE